jgi:hypothetical protein
MRVLVPRRILRLGILLAVLCLIPAISPPSAFAKPIRWDDANDPNPPAPKGDGDGTVVKAAGGTTSHASAAVAAVASGPRMSVGSMVVKYVRLVGLGYGLRWYY